MLSKRGFADIVVLFSILVILGILFYKSTVEIDELAQIGKDQNTLLDSYTTAEGARFYLEKSLEYSAILTAQDFISEGYDCNMYKEDKESETAFIKSVDDFYFKRDFMENAPTELNKLFVSMPDKWTIFIENDLLKIDFDRNIVVSNCAGSLKECDNNFKIKTEINADVVYDLSKLCDDVVIFSG